MPELSGSTPRSVAQNPIVRVSRLAERQWGVVRRDQLESGGVSGSAISKWAARGWIHRIYPRVYAVGHRALCVEGRLAAALLYAGPGAALSHTTGLWWLGLLPNEPRRIHLNAPGYRCCLPAIFVHQRLAVERVMHRGLPVVPVPQALRESAPMLPFRALRKALAEAEFQRLVKLDAVEAELGRGRRGSAQLRRALKRHRPELARTRSDLEVLLLILCEDFGIDIPLVNVKVAGLEVDCFWPGERLVVELDSQLAHGQERPVATDRRREMTLRKAGCWVLRYSSDQVTNEKRDVAEEVIATLIECRASRS